MNSNISRTAASHCGSNTSANNTNNTSSSSNNNNNNTNNNATSNNNNNTTNNNNNSSSSVISDYSLAKESFVCNECGTDFLNRDTLAMHVMENVRDGTCQKAMGEFVKVSTGGYLCSSGNGSLTTRRSCPQNSCLGPDHVTSPIFPDRLSKKTRDVIRSNKTCFSPPLPGCAQNLLRTLINPLTLPGWFRMQQDSQSVEPTGTRPMKDAPWCSNVCPYNGDMLMSLHHPGRVCPESLLGSEALRRRAFDRRDLHTDASELRKRRVEKWKESVGRERGPMVNWLTYKTLAMLNGQPHFKMQDALGQMLNVMDYAKLGVDPVRIPVPMGGESCSVTSSDNNIRPDMIHSDGPRIDESSQPTPTVASKSDAMSSSWAGDSVMEFKVSDSTAVGKSEMQSPCDTTASVREGPTKRNPRSQSTPPRLDNRTDDCQNSFNGQQQTDLVLKNHHSNSHSEMMHDSGLGSELGVKADPITRRKIWSPAPAILHSRPLLRKPGLGRSILGKRSIQKVKRLRRSAHLASRRSRRDSSPVSGADSTSCRTSPSSANSPIRTPSSTIVPPNRGHSHSSQTVLTPSHISEVNTSASGSDAASKNGTRLPFYCSHCQIGFQQKTLFSLHMGLHCVDQPWKCNMCGQFCSGVYEFTAHTLHF